jgi:hypothetical protein
MKIKSFIAIILIAIMMLFIMNAKTIVKKSETNALLLPSLPRPITKEYALITSAGQSTEANIVEDVANKLMINNYFMPQAKDTDLAGINTIVFVVGYSPFGEKLNGMSYENEKKRIIKLLQKSKEEKLVVITVYIGYKEQRDKRAEELLRLICPKTAYLIGTEESDYDGFLSELAKKSRIPLTLINGVNNIAEPFASAFR